MAEQTSHFWAFLDVNPDYESIHVIHPYFTRVMTVAKYSWGYVIETDYVDDDGVVTLETLFSTDGKTAVLAYRLRSGKEHNDMKAYPRDNVYPIGCVVQLLSTFR